MGRRNRVAKTTQIYENRKLEREWKAAIYGRLSVENNRLEDERSLRNQIRYIEDFISKTPNLRLTGIYADNGFSGTNFDRPEFARLMDDVKSGIIDCIVVKDLSRFGRNFLETGYYLEKIFPYLNVRFIAINDDYDGFDPTKKDALTVPIKNLVNEVYTKDISRKLCATFRSKEKKGLFLYGVPPYGYIKDEENPFRLAVDREAEPYIRQMFKWSAGGVGFYQIAKRLNEMDAPTPWTMRVRHGITTKSKSKHDKSVWVKDTVKAILENPIYMGDMVYGGVVYGGAVYGGSITDVKHKNRKSGSDWRVIPDTHEALVSREDFAKAQANIEARKAEALAKTEYRKEQREALPDILRGKFFCHECGRVMLYQRNFHAERKKNGSMQGEYIKTGSPYRNYCCSGYISDREGWDMDADTTPACRKTKNAIDDRLCRMYILDQIRLQLEAGFELKELERLRAKAYEDEKAVLSQTVRSKETEYESFKGKLHKLYEDYAEKIIDSDDYICIREAYTEEMKICESELTELREKLKSAESGNKDTEWEQLKERIKSSASGAVGAGAGAVVGTGAVIGTGEDYSVEILEYEPPLIPGLDKLTKELVDEMIERVEYGADKSLHITFKHKDRIAELAEKMEGMERMEKSDV